MSRAPHTPPLPRTTVGVGFGRFVLEQQVRSQPSSWRKKALPHLRKTFRKQCPETSRPADLLSSVAALGIGQWSLAGRFFSR